MSFRTRGGSGVLWAKVLWFFLSRKNMLSSYVGAGNRDWQIHDSLYFTRLQAAALIASCLGAGDPADPRASLLYSGLAGLPPVRVHVGDDEVLLDDAGRCVERAAAAGVDARLEVWHVMAHGFLGGISRMAAASQALAEIGHFLSGRLAAIPVA